MQVLVGARAQRFEAEVINNQQLNAGQASQLAFVGAGSTRRIQAGGEVGTSGEQDVSALSYGAVALRLRQM